MNRRRHHERAGEAMLGIAQGALDDAEAVLNGAPATISHAAEIEGAHAKIALARGADLAQQLQALLARLTDKESGRTAPKGRKPLGVDALPRAARRK